MVPPWNHLFGGFSLIFAADKTRWVIVAAIRL